MDSTCNTRTTASITVAQDPEATTTPDVPPELMLKILQHLPQHDLRIFAQASRACYAHALESGLCICRDIFWTNEDGFGGSLKRLDAVIDHAENRPGLNVAITVMTMLWGDDAAVVYHNDMERLVASIRRALPYLVRLQVPLTDYAALCSNEAPKLQTLTIYHPGLDVPSLIPPNLFNGCAPRLRKVELGFTETDSMAEWQPIATFSSIDVKLSAGRIARALRLARLFPALRVLAVDAGSAPPTQSIDMRGLTALRHFALAGDTALLDDASLALLRSIPVFEHEPQHPAGADPVWPTHCGELCAVVERCGVAGPPTISFVPRDPGTPQWRRTILLQSLPGGALPLPDVPRLVSLTVNASLLNALAQPAVMLDRLRELVVDLCQQPRVLDDSSMSRLLYAVARMRCPALERVVLLSLPDDEGTGAMKIGLEMIARLTLALRVSTAHPTLRLILAGSGWTRPDTVPGSTSSPRPTSDADPTAKSTAVGVPEYYDRCRWTDLFDDSQ